MKRSIHFLLRRRIALVAALAVPVALTAIGCGSSGTSSSSGAAKTSAAEPSKSTQAAQAPSQPSSTPSSSNGAAIGATEAAWAAAHTSDNDFTEGSAYDRDPSLGEVEGHTAARYTGVDHKGDRIAGYVYHFPSSQIDAAKRGVLNSQFPADAHVVAFAVRPTCGVMIVRSATLTRKLSPIIGHPADLTFVRFTSGPEESSYDSNAVTGAEVGPTASKNPADVVC
jgi:hypothetical protein